MAAFIVSPRRSKSLWSEKGFWCGASCRKGTKYTFLRCKSAAMLSAEPERPSFVEMARMSGAPAVSCETAAEGVRRALEESGGETPVVACGSLYLMGEIREAVKSGR
mgnify:FL=1